MGTGDKTETAINIGHSCKLLDSNQPRIDLVRIRDKQKLKFKIHRNLDRLKKGMPANAEEYFHKLNFKQAQSYDNTKPLTGPTVRRNQSKMILNPSISVDRNLNLAEGQRITRTAKSVSYDKDQTDRLKDHLQKRLSDEKQENKNKIIKRRGSEVQFTEPEDSKPRNLNVANKSHRRNRTVTFFATKSIRKEESDDNLDNDADPVDRKNSINNQNNNNNKEPTENLLKKPVPIQIYDNFANYLRKLFYSSNQKLKDFDHQGQINPVFNGNPDEKIF